MALKVSFVGVEFENPFILSSAPPTNKGEMIARAFDAGWAGAVVKTLVPEDTVIENVTPRFHSLAFPGFEDEPRKIYTFHNIELTSDRRTSIWLDEIRMLRKEYPSKVIIGSIMADGNDKKGWQELARAVENAGVQIIELNFSCPHGGMPGECVGKAIGQDPNISCKITSWVKEVVRIPVVVKLTPNVTDVTVIGNAVKSAGANGITAINTISSLPGVNIYTFEPLPSVAGYSAFSGYSGPGIKPIALRIISELYIGVGLPISGVGGISSWQDAVEFMLCGATTVQLATAVMLNGYQIIEDLLDGLSSYMDEMGFTSIENFRGKATERIRDLMQLDRKYKVKSSINESLCVKCDICFRSCRDGGYNAIEPDESRLPHINEEKCTGCSLCMQVCPVEQCVSMRVASN